MKRQLIFIHYHSLSSFLIFFIVIFRSDFMFQEAAQNLIEISHYLTKFHLLDDAFHFSNQVTLTVRLNIHLYQMWFCFHLPSKFVWLLPLYDFFFPKFWEKNRRSARHRIAGMNRDYYL
jgi:hypothetical protein